MKQLKKQNLTISTFSDNRFSEGNLYEKLGFVKESEVRPDYWYFKQGTATKLIHKFNFRKARIRRAFPEVVFNENNTELQMTQKLGYDRSHLWVRVQANPALQKIIQDEREGMVDLAEGALKRAVLAGEAWAVCFALKCQGKRRGYIERYEHDDVSQPKEMVVKVQHDGNFFGNANRLAACGVATPISDPHGNGAPQAGGVRKTLGKNGNRADRNGNGARRNGHGDNVAGSD